MFELRHYRAIASVLKTHLKTLGKHATSEEYLMHRELVNSFCRMLAVDNERFDHNRFITACGDRNETNN